ncbi:hypothetical protein GGI35DRAFT_488230 [Trichoderma velutinum]
MATVVAKTKAKAEAGPNQSYKNHPLPPLEARESGDENNRDNHSESESESEQSGDEQVDDETKRRYKDYISGRLRIPDDFVHWIIENKYPTTYKSWLSSVEREAKILRLPVHPADVDKPEKKQRKDWPMVVDFRISHFFVIHDPMRAPRYMPKDQYLIASSQVRADFKEDFEEGKGHWKSAKKRDTLLGKSSKSITWCGFAYDGRICYATGVLFGELEPKVWSRTECKAIWGKSFDKMVNQTRMEFGHPTLEDSKRKKASCDTEIMKKNGARVMSARDFKEMQEAGRRLSESPQ